MTHLFLKARAPFAFSPFTEMVVTSIPPTTPAGTLQARYPQQQYATGAFYQFLPSYTPTVGETVMVVNRPRHKFVLGKLSS